MIRLETYRSCEPWPAPERAFVTVGDIIEPNKDGKLRTVAHMTFYGTTAECARATADNWIAAERKRLEDIETAAAARVEKAKKTRTENREPVP